MPRLPLDNYRASPRPSPDLGHAFLSAAAVHAFRALGVGAALKDEGDNWWPLFHDDGVIAFEYEHRDGDRGPYNHRMLTQAITTGKAVRGELGGFSDLFVPIVVPGRCPTVLISGPFALERPTSSSVSAGWHWITGRQPHLADPQFASYLAASLGTLVLEGSSLQTFEHMVAAVAQLFAGRGRADQLADEINRCRTQLDALRLPDRIWTAVRSMLDDRSAGSWHSAGKLHDLLSFRLSRAPDQVLVGLSAGAAGLDEIDEALHRRELQRRVTELAHQSGEMIAGQVGDQGVVVLFVGGGRATERKQRILDFAHRISALARREFGISLHFGVAVGTGSESVGQRYQTALAAAQSALVQKARLPIADPTAHADRRSLRQLRRELGQVLDQASDTIAPKFERYLQAVAQHTAHRVEPARGHLEAGFERLAEPLVSHGALDEKGFRTLCDALDQRAQDAQTLSDLFAAYRRAVAELVDALKRPGPARHDRGLRGALDYLHRSYAGPVTVEEAARHAGITPDYFSKLFKQREHTTFEEYVRGLRLERAKKLLADTGIGIGKISEMSGFSSQQYFTRVFHRITGMTPKAYRRRLYLLPGPKRRSKKTRHSAKT